MATDYTTSRTKSNTQILQELEALSDTLYQSHTSSNPARRTNSLALPRTAIPSYSSVDETNVETDETTLNPKPRTRRMSLSPWRSRPKLDSTENQPKSQISNNNKFVDNEPLQASASSQKKGIWNWKPIRALAHIGMQKLSCLFSVEVVSVENLPASMNGLRLSVCVRKKENKDGAVQTMPSRVSHGAADFEETLFIRCHVYYSPGTGTHMKFEPRPFLLYVSAVDAEELDFGKSSVDLSALIQESIERSFEGTRIRQWDKSFNLVGKAKGGELVLKLGFQIMEKDGGVGIYSQAEGRKGRNSPSVARKQSKTSFSVPSPRMTSRAEAWTPSRMGTAPNDLHEIDDLNLDEPAPPPLQPAPKKLDDQDTKLDDQDLPDFDVVDKGVEIQDKDDGEENHEEQSEENNSDKRSVSSEVVKEVVQDQTAHLLTRLTELDLIAQQIKALESMMGSGAKSIKADDEEETGSQMLDADEDKVTREFFQMLEDDDDDQIAPLKEKIESYDNSAENDVVSLPDLGKGLGCVVQTRNGGYLAATNPLNATFKRKETPKLAMQMSKPLIIQSNTTGFEMFQKIAATGLEELTSQMVSLMPIDELTGKTAEQIAFEGIASAIIQGRNNKEGASSSAAKTIAAVKNMSSAMINGRKERASTGIWNVSEEPMTADDILAFSLQKIENMAVEALKIQADVADEEAPFDVSPIDDKTDNRLLASAVPVEDWDKTDGSDTMNISVSLAVQLRDPGRQYEVVGGPMIALVHVASVDDDKSSDEVEERKYKVTSMQVGGVRVRSGGTRSVWDTEKQKLTALQWVVANGMAGKASGGGKKGKRAAVKGGPDVLWSVSSRVMADMWLKPIRNPDVKFLNK